MNSQARIEHHHDLQESWAEVYLTDMLLGFGLHPRRIDRAVMFEVERGFERVDRPRPERRAA